MAGYHHGKDALPPPRANSASGRRADEKSVGVGALLFAGAAEAEARALLGTHGEWSVAFGMPSDCPVAPARALARSLGTQGSRRGGPAPQARSLTR